MRIKIYDLIFESAGTDKHGTQLYKLHAESDEYRLYSDKVKVMRKPISFWKHFFLKRFAPKEHKPYDVRKSILEQDNEL